MKKQYPIANIAQVVLKAGDYSSSDIILKDICESAECLAHISEGEEAILRVKNRLIAQNNQEDLILGYDIALTSAILDPEALELIDGGKWEDEGETYKSNPVGQAVERKKFDLEIWTEVKDCDGSTVEYVVFEFPSCKGTPLDFNYENGQFFVPEMKLKSRPSCFQAPIGVRVEESLGK